MQGTSPLLPTYYFTVFTVFTASFCNLPQNNNLVSRTFAHACPAALFRFHELDDHRDVTVYGRCRLPQPGCFVDQSSQSGILQRARRWRRDERRGLGASGQEATPRRVRQPATCAPMAARRNLQGVSRDASISSRRPRNCAATQGSGQVERSQPKGEHVQPLNLLSRSL